MAETLLRLIEQEGYDTIFASVDLALAAIAQHRHRLSASAHIACPAAEVVESVLSKEQGACHHFLFQEWVPGIGVRVELLIEVNGRFWGSAALADAAGFEFPWYQWLLLHDIDPKVPDSYRVGGRIAWTAGRIERLVDYLTNRPPESILTSSSSREIASFLRYLLPFTRDAVWRLNDLLAPGGELEQVGRKLLKSLPSGVKRFERLNGKAKLAYLRMRQGLGRSNVPKINRASSILIVCHGNIIRSAFAEALMKRNSGSRGIEVASCGTHASAPAADAMAIACADSLDIDLTSHRPQKVTEELLDRADLVLAMDWFNLAHLVSDYPEVAPAKTVLFSAYGSRAETIQDPYGRDWKTFRRCFRQIQEHTKAIREQLS